MKGVLLVGWDDRVGPMIEFSYPKDNSVDEKKIIEYLITIQALSTSNILFFQDSNQSVLIYGIPTKSPNDYNYSYLVVILEENDKIRLESIKNKMRIHGPNILWANGTKKRENFDQFIEDLINPKVFKIVFMGFPNAGKTSVKRFFFENLKTDAILSSTISPTEGFETNLYDIIDVRISHYDTSGQELQYWFSSESNVLLESELVIFFFSVNDWLERKDSVKDYLEKLHTLLEKEKSIKKATIFCHKIDILEQTNEKSVVLEDFKKEIRDFVENMSMKISFTTIKNGGNAELTTGLQEAFLMHSQTIKQIKEIFDYKFSHLNIKPLFLLKSSHSRKYILTKGFKSTQNYNALQSLLFEELFSAKSNSEGSLLFFYTREFEPKVDLILCFGIQPIFPEFSYLICSHNKENDVEGKNILDTILKEYKNIIAERKIEFKQIS